MTTGPRPLPRAPPADAASSRWRATVYVVPVSLRRTSHTFLPSAPDDPASREAERNRKRQDCCRRSCRCVCVCVCMCVRVCARVFVRGARCVHNVSWLACVPILLATSHVARATAMESLVRTTRSLTERHCQPAALISGEKAACRTSEPLSGAAVGDWLGTQSPMPTLHSMMTARAGELRTRMPGGTLVRTAGQSSSDMLCRLATRPQGYV